MGGFPFEFLPPVPMSFLLPRFRALLVLLLATFVLGANRAAEGESCRRCDSVGYAVCTKQRKNACPDEGALFCSERHECDSCGGSGLVDCPHCENPAADAKRAEAAATQAKLAEKWASIDAVMGFGVRKAQSEHFFLTWEIRSLKVGRKRLAAHALMHLYLERLEAVYARYLEALGAEPSEFKKTFEVYVWEREDDQLKASIQVCGQGSGYGVRLLGAEPHFSVCGGKRFFANDELLHRHLVHNATHLILSHQRPSAWVGNQGHGWLDEGLAHWFEQEFFERCDNYCYEEQDTSGGRFRGGDYRVMARKLVATDAAPPVARVLSRNTDGLLPDEHVVAMSLVDYFVTQDGLKLGKLARALRIGTELRKPLDELYGVSPLSLERAWREWVLDTYPTR